MLVCSSLTFIVMLLIDTPFTEAQRVGAEGFLPSLTFVAPFLWNRIIPVSNWIDGAYWSLFVEVRFYFWALAIAMLLGTRYLAPALAISAVGLTIVWHFSENEALLFYLDTLFFVPYLPLFAAGTLSYRAFTERNRHWFYIGLAIMWLTEMTMLRDTLEYLIVSGFFMVFFVLIQKREWLGILTARPLTWIGLTSYSLYLLHQNIGVAVLSTLPQGWPLWAYALAALFTLGGMMLLAHVVYLIIERPAQSLARHFDRKYRA